MDCIEEWTMNHFGEWMRIASEATRGYLDSIYMASERDQQKFADAVMRRLALDDEVNSREARIKASYSATTAAMETFKEATRTVNGFKEEFDRLKDRTTKLEQWQMLMQSEKLTYARLPALAAFEGKVSKEMEDRLKFARESVHKEIELAQSTANRTLEALQAHLKDPHPGREPEDQLAEVAAVKADLAQLAKRVEEAGKEEKKPAEKMIPEEEVVEQHDKAQPPIKLVDEVRSRFEVSADGTAGVIRLSKEKVKGHPSVQLGNLWLWAPGMEIHKSDEGEILVHRAKVWIRVVTVIKDMGKTFSDLAFLSGDLLSDLVLMRLVGPLLSVLATNMEITKLSDNITALTTPLTFCRQVFPL